MNRRRLRLGFVLGGTLLSLGAIAGAALVGSVVFLKTEAGNRWLGAAAEQALGASVTGGEVSIGALHTDLWGRWRLDDVVLTADDGKVVARVRRVGVDLAPTGLLRRTLVRPVVRIEDAELALRTLPDGTLEIVKMFGGPSESPEPSSGFPLAVLGGRLDVVGLNLTLRDVDGAPQVSASGLDARADIHGQGEFFRFDDVAITGVLVVPGPGSVEARGQVWTTPEGVWFDDLSILLPGTSARLTGGIGSRVQLHLDVDPLDLARLDPLVGSPGLAGAWSGDLLAVGPWDDVHVTGDLRDAEGSSGGVVADAHVDLRAEPIRWTGELDLASFHLDGALPATGPFALNGRLAFDGAGLRWPDDLAVSASFLGGPVQIGAQRLDTLDAAVRVADGKVQVERAKLNGIVGALDVSGDLDLTGGPMNLKLSGTLGKERLAALGIDGFGRDGVIDARVTGDLATPGSPIGVEGTVVWAPFHYGPDVRFNRLSAAFRTQTEDGVTTGSARVTTSPGEAYGVAVGSSSTPDVAFRVTPSGTSVGGTTRAVDVRYPGVAAVAVADAVWTADVGSAFAVRARVDFGAHDVLGFPGDAGWAQIDLAGEVVALDVALGSGARDAWRIVGDYRLADGAMTFETLALAPTPRATWTAAPGARLRVADGGVRDAQLVLEGNLGRVELTGDLTRSGTVDGRFQLAGFQADALAELYPESFDGLAGRVDLDVTVAGRAAAPVIAGRLDVDGLWYGGVVRWLDVSGTFSGADDQLSLALSTGVAGRPLAEVRGWLPVALDLAGPRLDTAGQVDLDIDLRPGELDHIGWLNPAIQGRLPPGRASASLHLGGRMGDPEIDLSAVAQVPVEGWVEPGRLELVAQRVGPEARLRLDLLDGLRPIGTIDGGGTTRLGEVFSWGLEAGPEPAFDDYSLYLDDLDVSVALTDLPVQRVLAATGMALKARGSLLGGFVVTGSPWAPVVEGGVQWLDPALGRQKLEGAYVSMVPSAGQAGYTADLELTFPREGSLRVSGEIGVQPDFRRPFAEWSTGPLNLEVGGAGFPLGVLSAFVPGVRAGRSQVVIAGSVGGTPTDPDPRLTASITDGYFEVEALGMKFEHLDVHVSAEDRRVKLDTFSVYPEPLQRLIGFTEIGETAQSSRVTARGSMQLDGGVPDALSAVIKLENGAWVSAMPDALLRLEGDVSVSGRFPAVEVRGDIALHTGRLALDVASFAEAAPLEPDARLSIRRGISEVAEAEVVLLPSFFDEVDVDVGLELNRNLELAWSMPFVDNFGSLGAAVARMDMNARLGGRVDLEVAGGAPTITGEVEVVEGDLRFFRSNFDLQAGTITFTGGDPYEPNLDIAAQMVVPGATVDVKVAGTPSSPDVSFASEDIPDETAILTVLITGASPEDLTTDQGAAAANAAAGVLLNSVLSGANLGSLSIDPSGLVKVGLPVSQRIYAESLYKPNAMSDENLIALTMEWTMLPRLVLSAGLGDYEQWTDLFWEVRF